MLKELPNIYKIARESVGFTQEKASELLATSVTSLKAYEYSQRIPPDDIVIKMIEIYDAQYLAYQHLKTSVEVGKKYLPNIEITQLPIAILKLQKEVSDFIKCKDLMVEITCDGVIDDNERPQWNMIMKELDDIVTAIMSLKFAK